MKASASARNTSNHRLNLDALLTSKLCFIKKCVIIWDYLCVQLLDVSTSKPKVLKQIVNQKHKRENLVGENSSFGSSSDVSKIKNQSLSAIDSTSMSKVTPMSLTRIISLVAPKRE